MPPLKKTIFDDPALKTGVDPLGQFVGIGKEETDKGTLFFGERDPVTGKRQERFAPGLTTESAPSFLDGGQDLNISQGSEILESEKIKTDQDIADTETEVDQGVDFASRFKELEEERQRIREVTDEDLKQIEEAGAEVKGEFETIIAEVEESKRQGLAKDLIRRGERGGLLSSQIIGEAVKAPIVSGGFIGAGGALERTKSAFDTQISNLRVKQRSAIDAAKAAARKAIKEGKTEDFKASRDLLDLARGIKSDIEKAEIEKRNVSLREQAEERTAAKFPFEQIQLIADTLESVLEGQEFTIGDQVFVGTKVPEEEKAFFSASNIVSLMGQLTEGETITLPPDPVTGRIWTVSGTKDPATVSAFDDQGNLSVIRKDNGEVISKAIGVGKTKAAPSNVSVNFPRQTQNALFDEGGKQIGFALFNPITTQTAFTDFNGASINFPEGGRIGSVSSKFEEEEEDKGITIEKVLPNGEIIRISG